MSKKSILFFSLISLSIITEILTENVIIPKYGKKKIYENQNAFLDVSGFDSGEKIYISITTSSYSHSYNTKLGYAFYKILMDCLFHQQIPFMKVHQHLQMLKRLTIIK